LSALAFVTAWANAPFAIAVGVSALFALLQLTGILALLSGHAAGDGDADHDVDHDVDADADADGDHDAEHDADQAGGRNWGAAVLAPLGLGKIPLSIVWQVHALVFALSGFALNLRYLDSGSSPPLVTLAWTLPFSLLAGYLAVAVVAHALGPVLSSKAQEATTRSQLVGQIGVVISSKVDEQFGEIRIRDKDGHDVRLVCKLAKGAGRAVEERRNVVVVEVDDEQGGLLVEPLDDVGDDENEASRKEAFR
jgi:hypothetical protein